MYVNTHLLCYTDLEWMIFEEIAEIIKYLVELLFDFLSHEFLITLDH